MRTWSAARASMAALAVASAGLTAATVAVLDTSDAFGPLLLPGYVAITALAAIFPAAITVQVVGGQLLVGAQLVGGDVGTALMLVPAIAGVVLTAELLAAVARLDRPARAEAGEEGGRAGVATLIGTAVFAAVALAGSMPGPSGVLAVALAAGACLVIGTRLARGGV